MVWQSKLTINKYSSVPQINMYETNSHKWFERVNAGVEWTYTLKPFAQTGFGKGHD